MLFPLVALADIVNGIDETVLRAINDLAGRSLALDVVVVLITAFGMSYVIVLLFFPLWLARKRTIAIDLVLVIVVSIAVETILKALVARDRPFVTLDDLNAVQVDFLNTASGYSFPSGHATRAFAVGVFLWLSLKHPWRHIIPIGAALVAVSRVFLGLHWPTDVLAGALLGSGLAILVYFTGMRCAHYARTRDKLILLLEKTTTSLRPRT